MNIFLSDHAARLASRFMMMAAIALFCYSSNALAQSTEIQDLKLEIEVLKKRVQELESANPAKVPEAATDPKIIQAPVAPEIPKVKGNPWQSLQVNQSKSEVTSLLGKPGKIDKWKTGEAWYFPNPRGGEVDFNADENVTGWLEP